MLRDTEEEHELDALLDTLSSIELDTLS